MTLSHPPGLVPELPPRPRWLKFVLIAGSLFGLAVVGLVVVLVLVGMYGIDNTKAIPGANVPRSHLETIRKLGLIDEGEKIRYFYSDALFDLKGGMYFFTDKKVVIYQEGLPEVPTLAPFDSITDISADFSDSTWEDGTVWISRGDEEVSFPIPKDGGKRFYEVLTETWKKRTR